MSKYSDFLKQRKEKDLEFFFGKDIKYESKKYFTFNRIHDDDNITIITPDVTIVKESAVPVVGENKAVYLKEWAFRPVHNFEARLNTWAVKLCRKYFKVYTFKKPFYGYEGMAEKSFDDYLQLAAEQNRENMPFACGHTGPIPKRKDDDDNDDDDE